MLANPLTDVDLPTLALGAGELRTYESKLPTRNIACGHVLFETGDVKTHVYRVETGALCIYALREDLTHEVIEYALAGDIVGMGFLEKHASTARATVDTCVRCIPLGIADKFTSSDERAQKRLDAAMRREFASRRDSLVAASQDKPVIRLASFLVAMSYRNVSEGRDPNLIDGAVESGVVADYLGCSVDLLALAFANLEMQGLVQAAPNRGLRLTNIRALEELAAA